MSPFRSEAQSRAAFGGYLGKKMQQSAKEWASKTNYSKLPKRVKHHKKYSEYKRKLGVKTSKPGDLLKAYKKKVVTGTKWFAETETGKNKVIKINKKLHKTHPLHKKQYPELADTIYHEKFHALHPQVTEKETYKKTHKAIKTMGRKEKNKLYSLFN